jgi:mono/diheme cytochrome c family protein
MRARRKQRLIAGFVLLLCAAAFAAYPTVRSASGQTAARRVDFVRDIQPIFQSSCAPCHAGGSPKSGLRLDNKKLALAGGIGGAVIVPGSAEGSRLMHRILGLNGEKRMPLGGEPLKAEQIELIRRWIDEGAEWPESAAGGEAKLEKHWAFVAPTRPAPPTVKNISWARTPVDRFILAKLEQQGLAPSAPARRTTLIRRLSLDLTGLPPTLAEIDRFVNDPSSDAYEKLVERLLSSPHYGERWGRWWLDAARYADTNGFEKDLPRSIWPYRDWVIKAFNRDLPFDQFTIEQLAGDLLPNSTLDQRIATGFLRNSMLNQEGGVDPEQFRVEGLIDRVDAVGKAFLGLTVACAQCHTHKFDPIKHDEYYKFFAFLNSDDEPEIEVPDEEVTKKRAEILSKVRRIEDDLIAGDADLPRRMAAWEERAKAGAGEWTVLEDASIFASFGVKFDRLEDGSFLPKGDNSTFNTYVVKARTHLKNITGFRLELMTDPNLPRGGPGRANDGSLFVSEFAVEAAPAAQAGSTAATAAPATQPGAKPQKVVLSEATADFAHPDFPTKNVIDGDFKTHWSSDAGPGRRNQERRLVFAAAAPVGFDGGTLLTFNVTQKKDDVISLMGGKPNVGRFRLSVTTAAAPQADPLPAGVRRLLSVPAAERTAEQRREVFSYYRTTDQKFAEASKQIDELMKDWPYGATTLALAPRATPRETRVFRRGDWKRPGDAVQPGTPAFLHPFPQDAPPNRLGLARWIVAKDNPLTARVIVNRVWQQYFGTGLVTTPEDFGTRCEKPSHPELLDWLAVEFMEGGWSLKKLHRLIVNSATYRQSSAATPRLREADPTNRWLARAPRLRVEAEAVRDIALAAGGLLSPKVGGPSVYPPIPEGVLSLGYGPPMPWETSKGEDRYRRAMYTFWKRSVPYPSLSVFDAPNADFSCTRRVRSNTPLQALTTLNDAVFMEAAQGLALRVFKEGGATDRERMVYAFRLATGRRPDAVELQKLLAFLAEQRAHFAENTAAAVYVSAADLNKLPEGVDLHKVAPWTMVARVLLNLDETITKE